MPAMMHVSRDTILATGRPRSTSVKEVGRGKSTSYAIHLGARATRLKTWSRNLLRDISRWEGATKSVYAAFATVKFSVWIGAVTSGSAVLRRPLQWRMLSTGGNMQSMLVGAGAKIPIHVPLLSHTPPR